MFILEALIWVRGYRSANSSTYPKKRCVVAQQESARSGSYQRCHNAAASLAAAASARSTLKSQQLGPSERHTLFKTFHFVFVCALFHLTSILAADDVRRGRKGRAWKKTTRKGQISFYKRLFAFKCFISLHWRCSKNNQTCRPIEIVYFTCIFSLFSRFCVWNSLLFTKLSWKFPRFR